MVVAGRVDRGEDTAVLAVVAYDYGPPESVEVRDVPDPIAGEGEVLLRVTAAGLNPLDLHFLTGEPLVVRLAPPFGLVRPKRTVPGAEVAGVVEVVGAGVEDVRPGDEVHGFCDGGALAERITVPAAQVVPTPERLSAAQAGSVAIAATTALQGLRDHGGVGSGDRVLIVGASGGVGTFAVQIAKAMGAHVTGVCSGRNAELVRDLGADEVIDYTREDFWERDEQWEVALHVAGRRSARDTLRALTADGTLVLIGGGDGARGRIIGKLGFLIRMNVAGLMSSRTVTSFTAKETREDLLALNELFVSGAVTPVVERTYPLDEAAQGLRHVADGRTRGKVVVTPTVG
jgi:NADPH:quinone reductase-like Zn-dependent oxidoreductase